MISARRFEFIRIVAITVTISIQFKLFILLIIARRFETIRIAAITVTMLCVICMYMLIYLWLIDTGSLISRV